MSITNVLDFIGIFPTNVTRNDSQTLRLDDAGW